MYRSRLQLNNLIILTFTVSMPFGLMASDCSSGLIGENCVVTANGGYIYSNEYNNKKSNEQSDLVTATADSTTISLPAGYYSAKKITWTSAGLMSVNFAVGKTFFSSLTGDLPLADPSVACSYSGTSSTKNDAGGCYIPAASYFYNDQYGGRDSCKVETDGTKLKISDNSPTIPGCWLDTTDTAFTGFTDFTIKSSSSIPQCSDVLTPLTFKTKMSCLPALIPGITSWIAYENTCGTSLSVMANQTSGCYIDKNGLYVQNDSACVDGENTSVCKAASNKYVYKAAFGGRGTPCDASAAGQCFLADDSSNGDNQFKAIDNQLNAGYIRSGKTIFGVTGTLPVSPITWGSGLHRSYNPAATRLTYTAEKALNITGWTGTYSHYRPIPEIDKNVSSEYIAHGFDRTGGIANCGSSSNLWNRQKDCGTQNLSKATHYTPTADPADDYDLVIWSGKTEGNAGQENWLLIAKNATGEVWQDAKTKLFWSEIVDTKSWCIASGKHNNSSLPGAEIDPNNICDQPTSVIQNQETPESLCFEATGFATAATTGKAGLSKSTSPKIIWRLPTMHDYILANHHGLRAVVADRSAGGTIPWLEWTATVSSANSAEAWVFNMANGTRTRAPRNYANKVRCVGRLSYE